MTRRATDDKVVVRSMLHGVILPRATDVRLAT